LMILYRCLLLEHLFAVLKAFLFAIDALYHHLLELFTLFRRQVQLPNGITALLRFWCGCGLLSALAGNWSHCSGKRKNRKQSKQRHYPTIMFHTQPH